MVVEPFDNLGNTLLDSVLGSLDGDLRVQGRLIGGGDASELLDLASAGLLVETLGITLLGDLEGHVDVDLDEGDGLVAALVGLGVQLSGDVTVCSVGGDERSNSDGGRIGKELGDLI